MTVSHSASPVLASPITRRLVRVEIIGLLGEFDYKINFPAERRFMILYGPNGVGKTHVLRLIEAAFSTAQWLEMLKIDFSSAKFSFSDSSELKFERTAESQDEGVEISEPETSDVYDLGIHLIEQGKQHHWSTKDVADNISPAMVRRIIELELGYRPVGAGRYARRGTGRAYSLNEVILREQLTIAQFAKERHFRTRPMSAPGFFLEFIKDLEVTFVKTQRLVHSADAAGSSRDSNERRLPPIEGVSKSIQDLSDQVLAENSKISQRLDRTFPDRLLNFRDEDVLGDGEIKSQYREQQDFRERLSRFHLAGEDAKSVELPERELQKWEAKVLSQYLMDSDDKLMSFQALLEKMELFVKTANEHFYRKEISFETDRSISVTGKNGKRIPITSLSSGEQHELILLKYLLFDAKPNSTVLIDEPEISLHVAWQLAFLKDLEQISKVSGLRFVIATHSPQIISNHWESTYELGMPDAE